MGASTYTVTVTPLTVMGNKRVHRLNYSITSYGTDGVPLTPLIAGMAIIDGVHGFQIDGAAGAVANGPVFFGWDDSIPASAHFHAYKASNSECDAGVNFTTAGTLSVLVFGS